MEMVIFDWKRDWWRSLYLWKSIVNVTEFKIRSFSESISFYFPHHNIISGVQRFSNRNNGIFWSSTENIISEHILIGSTIGI